MKLNFNFESRENHFLTSGISHLFYGTQNIFGIRRHLADKRLFMCAKLCAANAKIIFAY